MTSALPTLPPHDASLLEDLLRLNADVQALAAKVNRPLHKLLDWALSPAIAAYIAAFKHFEIYREQARQLDALTKLSANLKTLEDPVQVRLTATTILRASHNLLHARAPRPRDLELAETLPERNIEPRTPARTRYPSQATPHQPAPIHESTLKPPSDPLVLPDGLPPLSPISSQVALDLSPPSPTPNFPRHQRHNQAQSLSLAAGAPHSRAP